MAQSWRDITCTSPADAPKRNSAGKRTRHGKHWPTQYNGSGTTDTFDDRATLAGHRTSTTEHRARQILGQARCHAEPSGGGFAVDHAGRAAHAHMRALR